MFLSPLFPGRSSGRLCKHMCIASKGLIKAAFGRGGVQSNRNSSIPLERKHHSEMWKENLPVTQISAPWSPSKTNDPTPPFFLASISPRSVTSGNAWHNRLSPQIPHTIALTPCLNSLAQLTGIRHHQMLAACSQRIQLHPHPLPKSRTSQCNSGQRHSMQYLEQIKPPRHSSKRGFIDSWKMSL